MPLLFLLACKSTPNLENDIHYAKLAIVSGKYTYSDLERKQTQAQENTHSNIGFGFGAGVSSAGNFGGIMLGSNSSRRDSSKEPPRIANGANRYTVQTVTSEESIEVMSYAQYQLGDCVKVLAGHPTEYPRFFALKAGEHCN